MFIESQDFDDFLAYNESHVKIYNFWLTVTGFWLITNH